MEKEQKIRKRRSEMTLEELTAKESEHLEKRKVIVDGFISKIQTRIDAAKTRNDTAEATRLEDLLKRHKEHKKELNDTNVNVIAKKRFDNIQERENKHQERIKEIQNKPNILKNMN
jgi:hypothetical protein